MSMAMRPVTIINVMDTISENELIVEIKPAIGISITIIDAINLERNVIRFSVPQVGQIIGR